MATACPTGFSVDELRARVRETYDRLARAPDGEFHFHRGAAYAVGRLGYDPRELAALPGAATRRFAGVGNPLRIGPILAAETVLDHACGAGTDLLLAARRVGPRGHAIGVDMTPAIRAQALEAASAAGLASVVDVRAGLMEDLPVADASVDVVISNGVVNLSPDKPRVFREIARVLRPGGRLYLADVVVARELALEVREDPELWAACIGGAVREDELAELAAGAGLEPLGVSEHFDTFGGASAGNRLSADLKAHGVNFLAQRRAS
jgi:SAM-dependent methyltransferase